MKGKSSNRMPTTICFIVMQFNNRLNLLVEVTSLKHKPYQKLGTDTWSKPSGVKPRWWSTRTLTTLLVRFINSLEQLKKSLPMTQMPKKNLNLRIHSLVQLHKTEHPLKKWLKLKNLVWMIWSVQTYIKCLINPCRWWDSRSSNSNPLFSLRLWTSLKINFNQITRGSSHSS